MAPRPVASQASNGVLPGLYLGSFRDGKDSEQLQVNQITHIVSIHDTAKEVVEDKQYLCIRVPDSPDENLSRYFPRCNDFIHSARMGGGNVLVHCLAGVSRSATIAAAYIMSVTSLNCKDALKVIRGARNIANPNYGFHSQLKEFESYSLTSERRRLKGRYAAYDNQKSDEEACAKMIVVYQSNIPSSGNSTPTHRYSKSPSTPSSSNSTPVHRYTFTPSSSNASPVHRHTFTPSSSNASPVHRHTVTPSSSNASPVHRYTVTPSSSNASPVHRYTVTPSSSNASPVHGYRKPSSSASSSPLSSPLHRLMRHKYRSASSSPKKS